METLKATTLVILIPFGWSMSEPQTAPALAEHTEACRLELYPVATGSAPASC